MTYCSLIFAQDSYYYKIAAKMYYIKKRNVRGNGNGALLTFSSILFLTSSLSTVTLP